MDAVANFAISSVATAPSPASSGTSLVVAAGEGARFPATPFNAVVAAAGADPTPANAEVVRVTNRSTDTLTITRAQESSSARSIVVGDRIFAAITAKTLNDLYGETGQVRQFPDRTVPSGWLECDGRPVSRTTYAGLYAVIGTTYGAGDGSTTFNLPDLRQGGISINSSGPNDDATGWDVRGPCWFHNAANTPSNRTDLSYPDRGAVYWTNPGSAAYEGAHYDITQPQPSFRAFRTASTQAVTNGNYVVFNGLAYDDFGQSAQFPAYDTSTGLFTPMKAGLYHIDWGVYVQSPTWVVGDYVSTALYANGSDAAEGSWVRWQETGGDTNKDAKIGGSAVVYLAGNASQSAGIVLFHNHGGSLTVMNYEWHTQFSAQYLGPNTDDLGGIRNHGVWRQGQPYRYEAWVYSEYNSATYVSLGYPAASRYATVSANAYNAWTKVSGVWTPSQSERFVDFVVTTGSSAISPGSKRTYVSGAWVGPEQPIRAIKA